MISLVGFYSDDPNAQERSRKELADLEAEITLLRQVQQKIESELEEPTDEGLGEIKDMLSKVHDMEQSEGKSVPVGKVRSASHGFREGLSEVGSRIGQTGARLAGMNIDSFISSLLMCLLLSSI